MAVADTLAQGGVAGGSQSYDAFLVMVGATTFTYSDDWPGYITDRLAKGIDGAAKGIEKAAKDHLAAVTKWAQETHGTRAWNGQLVNDSKQLQVRSGTLIDKFAKTAKVESAGPGLNTVDASIDVGVFGIHLDGGVVRARRSKFLTIPLPAACDRRGMPLKASSRDWPDTFVIKSKRGNLLICHKVNKRLVPLYLLKSSVRIPPRVGKDIVKVWDTSVNRYEKALISEIERAIDDIQW